MRGIILRNYEYKCSSFAFIIEQETLTTLQKMPGRNQDATASNNRVRSDRKELRITYSKKMNRKCCSWNLSKSQRNQRINKYPSLNNITQTFPKILLLFHFILTTSKNISFIENISLFPKVPIDLIKKNTYFSTLLYLLIDEKQ